MANKKIWAYGTNVSNEYFKDSLGRNRMFFIWEALKLKKENPIKYNEIEFWSTQNNVEERSRMTTVKNGFFRYIENQKGNTYSGDGESLSHSIAIAALSKLEELNFTIGEKKLKIIPEQISVDNLKVQFENGNYYFPDLICKYEKPLNLIEKWGDKIAIEVKVKHACEPIKIKDFENHNYPIIEITLNESMQFLKEINKESFNENDLERYYQFLIDRFSNNIYGKIISNPVKAKFHNKTVKRLLNKCTALEEEKSTLKHEFKTLLNNNKYAFKQLQLNIEKLEKTKAILQQENIELKSKTFFNKLKELFE